MSRNQIIGLVALVLTAFAFGRYTAPEKVKIEKEIVTVESAKKEDSKHVSTDLSRDKRVEKVITEIVRPDGTRETSTRVVEDTSTAKRSDTAANSREESNKASIEKSSETIEYGRNKLSLAVLAGAAPSFSGGLSFGPLAYGGHVQKNLLGPITFGVWALSSGTGGISLGLMF